MFEIGKLTRLDLGYQGENKARVIAIDMNAWLDEFPGANVGMLLRRPNEAVFYPAALEMEDGIIEFEVTRSDVAIEGEGEAQIILTNEDDVELRSRVVKTKINASMSGTEVEAPPPENTFVTKVINAAAKAEAAVEKMPSIGENGNWHAWDAAQGAYVDTGKPSKGKDGKSPNIKVGTVTTLNPGSKATVSNSGTEQDVVLDFGIPRGYDGTGGGGSSEGGGSGEDGGYYTPSVTDDGVLSWTPSKADMPEVEDVNIKGDDGIDIVSVVQTTKSSEDGGTNVITVTKSDGSTSSFEVKNGRKGSAGKDAFTAAVAVTVPSTAWTGTSDPYTATVACSAVTASNHIIVGAGGALTEEQQSAMAAAMIVCTGQGEGSITLTAYGTVPTIDLPVNVMIVG